MRKLVATETKPWPSGQLVVAGALRCERDSVPVILQTSNRQVGIAFDMQRDGDDVTMEIQIDPNETHLNIEEWDTAAWVTPFRLNNDKQMVEGNIAEIRLYKSAVRISKAKL